MTPNSDPNQRSRENMLAVSLVMLVGGMSLFFLYMISFGIVGNVLSGVVILVIVGSLHYLIWGQSFSAEVAAEREALRRQDAREMTVPGKKPMQEMDRTPAMPGLEKPRPASDAIQDMTQAKSIKPGDPEV